MIYMTGYLKGARWLAVIFLVAAVVFFLFAIFNQTLANPLVVALLALTWLVWGLLLLWVTRRVGQHMQERGENFDFDLDLSLQFRRKRKKNDAQP